MLLEYLKPISDDGSSQTTVDKWLGSWANIDEPLYRDGSETGDGSIIALTNTTLVDEFAEIIFDFSDIQNITDNDTLEGIGVNIRMRTVYDPILSAVPSLWVRLYIGGVQISPPRSIETAGLTFVNFQALTRSEWDAHIATLTVAQLNTLQIGLQATNIFELNESYEVDTLEVQISYSNPPPIEVLPNEGSLNAVGKTLVDTVNYRRNPALGSLVLASEAPPLFRQDIIRVDNYYLLLSEKELTPNFSSPVGKGSLALAGKSPILSQKRFPAADDLDLTGKVPDNISVTRNQWITIPQRYSNILTLQGQYVAAQDDDITGLPGHVYINLAGKVPELERSWTVESAREQLSLAGKTPILGLGLELSKLSVGLTGKNLEPVDTGDRIPVETLTLVGKVPVVSKGFLLPAGELILRINIELSVPGATLTLTGEEPIVRTVKPLAGSVTLVGKAPTFVFSTVLVRGDHRIISLTSRYEIEHIGTPSDVIEL